MSVTRIDLEKCVGCRNCVNLCPMDVFYFDEAANKSVMAFPEACQSCGQCYLHCVGDSIAMSTLTAAYMPSGGRALRTFANQTDLYVAETSSGGWGK